jgi:hypothetical protein
MKKKRFFILWIGKARIVVGQTLFKMLAEIQLVMPKKCQEITRLLRPEMTCEKEHKKKHEKKHSIWVLYSAPSAIQVVQNQFIFRMVLVLPTSYPLILWGLIHITWLTFPLQVQGSVTYELLELL